MGKLDNSIQNDVPPVVKSDSANSETHYSSLWQEAYENRGKIAATVLGAAAVAATVVVEHTPAGRALGLAKELLVIEDTSLFSHCIKRALLGQGESVTILKGVESLKPFVGILENGEKKTFNLNKIKAAFVDGNLEGELHGPAVTSALRSKNVFTVAMSSDNKVNDLMFAQGANLGEQKPVIMQALREDTLRVPDAMRDPFRTQAELDNRRFHFNAPDQSKARHQMEKEMMAEYGEEEQERERTKAAAKAQ